MIVIWQNAPNTARKLESMQLNPYKALIERFKEDPKFKRAKNCIEPLKVCGEEPFTRDKFYEYIRTHEDSNVSIVMGRKLNVGTEYIHVTPETSWDDDEKHIVARFNATPFSFSHYISDDPCIWFYEGRRFLSSTVAKFCNDQLIFKDEPLKNPGKLSRKERGLKSYIKVTSPASKSIIRDWTDRNEMLIKTYFHKYRMLKIYSRDNGIRAMKDEIKKIKARISHYKECLVDEMLEELNNENLSINYP